MPQSLVSAFGCSGHELLPREPFELLPREPFNLWGKIMPTLLLRELECYNPREIRDEPYIRVSTDTSESRDIWGPASMRRGNTIDLRAHVAPIVFHDIAHLSLRERDRGRDDYYGGMSFQHSPRPGLFNHYFPGDLNPRYRLNYEIRAEPAGEHEGRIRLLRLTCNDPQGTKDDITLFVNDRIIAGPNHRMRKGWEIAFTDMEIDFRHSCVIRLKESQGQDWERTIRLNRGEYPLDVDQYGDFRADDGILGDARYTLHYQMVS